MKDVRIGILGGGQLGRMLLEAASPYDMDISIMDKSKYFPAGKICTRFTEGDFQNYDDVISFGRNFDVITIEIESVNTEALHQLEKEGIKVYPQPAILETIKDKGLQKSFYKENNLPTSSFGLYSDKNDILTAIDNGTLQIPFVQKARTGGYDGKGVHVVKHMEDLHDLLDTPSVVESLVDIDKEIAVIVARNPSGEMKSFPVVEMEFHPTANLVEFLFCPSNLTDDQKTECIKISEKLATQMDIVGLLAVELFLDRTGQILINEVAPRPHNSGHHTIEACICSQYEQHLRAITDSPLGDTNLINPGVMINLLGAPDHIGKVHYQGLGDAIKIPGVHPHIYGKEDTKPFRKMGHVTIVNRELDKAISIGKIIKDTIKVVAK